MIITGAGRGYDLCLTYQKDRVSAGAVKCDYEAAGAKVLLLQGSVEDEAHAIGAFDAVMKHFGRIDVLVNNAGGTGPRGRLESITHAGWANTMGANVTGLAMFCREAVKRMSTKHGGKGGAIVNVSSLASELGSAGEYVHYAASKAAVVNMTKTLAWNLGPEIRVNAVAPGWMEGDWMERMLGDKYDDLMGKRAKLTPLKRCVTADDVAETMMSLIQGNRFVTGEIIVIDGGFTSST